MYETRQHKDKVSRRIVSDKRYQNTRNIHLKTSSNKIKLIQRQWIYNQDKGIYQTENLYDGVRWYKSKVSDDIYFEVEGPVLFGDKDKYKFLAGPNNAQSWEDWNEISILPFKTGDFQDDIKKEISFDSVITALTKGIQDPATKKSALETLKVKIPNINLSMPLLNKEIAKGNREVIKVLLSKSGIVLNSSSLKHIKSQFKNLDFSDVGEDDKTIKTLRSYTMSDFEYVTAFVRGYIWSKSEKCYEYANENTLLKGAMLLTRMNNIWDSAPNIDVDFSWRTENNELGEISKGGLNGGYVKKNPASTSINIIAHRAEKPENALLKIKNMNKGDATKRQPIDLRKYSQYPEEGEILYPAYTKYKVVHNSVLPKEGNYYYYEVDAELPNKDKSKANLLNDISAQIENPQIETMTANVITGEKPNYNNLKERYNKFLEKEKQE